MLENTNDTLDLSALPFYEWPVSEDLQDGADQGIPVDSIHQTIELPDTVYRESLLVHHSHPVVHRRLEVRPDNTTPTWIFVDLIVLSILLCLLIRLRNINMWELLKSAIDTRAMERLIRDCNLIRPLLMLPMGLGLVAAVCLPVHQMLLPETDIPGYLTLFACGSLLYILRNWMLRLLGNTFDGKNETSLYITSNYLYHLIESVIFVAPLFLYFYLPGGEKVMFYILSGTLVTVFVMRTLRGINIFLTHPNSSRFYLFYYLCIVEAIPILALIKWLVVYRPIS